MPPAQSRPEYTVRRCGDHFHVTIKRRDWDRKPLPAVLQSEQPNTDTTTGRWSTARENLYVRGRHKHNYNPFAVCKALAGEFYMLRRMNASVADAYCENCGKGGTSSHKKMQEVNWKLYRLDDISDQPFPSDLSGNDGLREDFASRQQSLRYERAAAEAERDAAPPPPYSA